MMGKENILIFLLFLIFCSCQEQQRLLDDALERAGDNRQELEKVLVHYRDSGLKYEAACYLIRNMPYYYSYRGSELDSAKAALAGSLETSDYVLPAEVVRRWNSFDYRRLEKVYDIDVMTANFLIQHIDHVFKVWEGSPWSVDYSFEDFCEWVLPYRIGDEPLELWSTEYYRLFSDSVASLYEGGGMRGWINAASDAINAWFAYNAEFRLPHLGADYLLHYRTGTCRERNDFMVYLLRSLGIPVTIDKYLYSPSNQHSHTWNAVRDSIGGLIPVWNVFRLTDTDGRKKGKVYRLCFARRSEKDTFCMSHDTDAQVTLDFGQSVPIRKVMLVPHTDDNFIRRGDWYELFYNDGIRGWRSLEKKQAVSGELFFDDIPSGALLWLRDLTRGREEQIFWLENGEQVFVGYE